jgi:hypothetical protein
MAKFIQTQLVDADPAFLVTTPEGDQDIYFFNDPIPVGSDIQRGIVLKTGYADENGEHYRWLPNTLLQDAGLIQGTISNLIYKGDHYSYIIHTELEQDFVVNDEDLWNMDDRVSLLMPVDKMKFTLKRK